MFPGYLSLPKGAVSDREIVSNIVGVCFTESRLKLEASDRGDGAKTAFQQGQKTVHKYLRFPLPLKLM